MVIQTRDLLNATVKALEILNTQDNPESKLIELVKVLGIGTDVDRCYIFKTEFAENNQPLLSQLCEYAKNNITVQIDNPDLQQVPYSVFPDLYESLLLGHPYYGHVKNHPNKEFREIMEAQDILSYVFAPIKIGDFLWGWIGFDNCSSEHNWTKDEINAIHTVAHSIAIRIESFQISQENKKSLDRYLISTFSSDMGIWEWNTENDTIFYSESALKMMGHNLKENTFSLDFFWQHLHEDDQQSLVDLVTEVKSKKLDSFQIKYRFRRPDGSIIWVKTKATSRLEDPKYFLGTNVDITTLMNQEIQINHQRMVLENLVEGSGYFALIAQPGDKVIYINQKAREVLGNGLLDQNDKPHWERIIHPDDWEKVWEYYYKQFESPKTEEVFFRFIDPTSGTTKFFKVFSYNQIDNPLINGVIFFAIDISDEQKLSKQLEETNFSLQGVLANMNHLFFTVNLESNNLILTNKKSLFIDKLGLTEEEISQSASSLLKLIIKDKKIISDINLFAQGNEKVLERTFKLQRQQSELWFVIKLTRRNYSSNIIDGSFIDITTTMTMQRLHEAEIISSQKRYEQIANNIHDMVCILDLDGNITFTSPASKEVLNYEPYEMQNFMFCDLVHPDDTARVKNKMKEISLSGKPYTCEIQMILKGGTPNWVEVYVSPLINSNGKVDSLQIAARNIEFRKKAEEENRKLLEKEREFSELKAHFVSMASHQFRTPLAVLHSNAEYIDLLVEKNLLDQNKLAKISSTFKREISRLTELMENILIFGRMENSLKLSPSTFNLREFIENILNNYFLDEINQRPIKLFVCDEITINTDELLLSHVLVNIVSNAYKYSPHKKSPEINCFVDKTDKIVIVIRDFGIGIPQAELEKVFESFYRASNTTTFQGTGLGLVLCKQFITTMQGNISIQSTEGIGTEVTIELPLSIA